MKNKNLVKLAAAFFMAAILIAPCFAMTQPPTPTITGLSGLVRVPDADTLPYKNFNLGVDYGTDPNNNVESMYYKLNLGTFRGTEMGVVGNMDQVTKRVKEGVFLNMKLSLATDDQPFPLKLAIGIENLTSYEQTDVFMVATKYLSQGPKLTFGFMGDFPNNKFRPLGCAGINIPFFDDYISLLGDIMAGESMTQVDVGARIFIGNTFAVHVNAVNIGRDATNNAGKDPKAYLIGFSWLNPF